MYAAAVPTNITAMAPCHGFAVMQHAVGHGRVAYTLGPVHKD